MPGDARLLPTIWEDLDGYCPHSRLLYAVLLTEQFRTLVGTMPLRLPIWAKSCGLAEEEAEKALEELAGGDPFTAKVVLDRRTDELLVRTYIRRDGIADKPNMLKSALGVGLRVRSPLLRRVLANELRKLPPKPPDKPARDGRMFVHGDPHATADVLDGGLPTPPETLPGEPFPNPSEGTLPGTLPEPARNPSEGTLPREPSGEGEGEGERSYLPVDTDESSSLLVEDRFALVDAATLNRPDVEALCERLAERVAANTGKRPTITAKWRTDCRLLLDRDLKHEPDRVRLVEAVLVWATDDTFWRSNILSMPKLREKFDQLRLKRREEAERTRAVSNGRPRVRTTDDKRAGIPDLIDEVFGPGSSAGMPGAAPHLRAIGGHA